MICRHCGATVRDGAQFCGVCGKSLDMYDATVRAAPSAHSAPAAPAAPSVVVTPVINNTVPAEYRPISAWGYFGYSLLFAIPLVGFICLIIFSFDNSNINRRNYARSFWCALLVVVIIMVVVGVLMALAGVSLDEMIYDLY